MEKEVLDFVVEKTHELMSTPACSAEAKTAAQSWLDALETDEEAAETKKYIAELEADLMPIDSLIAFAESDQGTQIFGSDTANNIAAHGREIKAAGAKYCDCPACAAAAAILEKKDTLL